MGAPIVDPQLHLEGTSAIRGQDNSYAVENMSRTHGHPGVTGLSLNIGVNKVGFNAAERSAK